MTKLCRYLAVAAIAAVVVAISDSGKRKCYNELATFNTALFPDVPEVEERTDILIQQVHLECVLACCTVSLCTSCHLYRILLRCL